MEVLEDFTQTLTSDLLKAAANKYLSGENFMQFVLLPEKEGQ